MTFASKVAKYLQRYAEPDVPSLRPPPRPYVAVIPAFRERESLPKCIDSLMEASNGDANIIIVLNASVSTWEANLEEHRETMDWFRPNPNVFVVERFTAETTLPDDAGVGLARKIGADLALRWMTGGTTDVKRIFMTDADAQVPLDFFTRPETTDEPRSAWLYPFVHVASSPEHGAALFAYDASIRLHAIGLALAGSPYAYLALGSILAIDAVSYAAVRGFPKRAAGEDFYLLQKLAKIAPLERLQGSPILIEGRPSDRVPFGTGPALRTQQEEGRLWTAYAPSSYRRLGNILRDIDLLVDDERACLLPATESVLEALGARQGLVKSLRGANVRDRHTRLHSHFDALRTLRCIHVLRDLFGYPEVAVEEALADPLFANLGLKNSLAGMSDASSRILRGPVGPTIGKSQSVSP